MTSAQATIPLQPADAALYRIATAVYALVEARSTVSLVRAPRNDGTYASHLEIATYARVAVALIAGDDFRAYAWPAWTVMCDADRVKRGARMFAVVRLAGAQRSAERQPSAVSDEMDLRSEAAARAPQGVVVGLAIWDFFSGSRRLLRQMRGLLSSRQAKGRCRCARPRRASYAGTIGSCRSFHRAAIGRSDRRLSATCRSASAFRATARLSAGSRRCHSGFGGGLSTDRRDARSPEGDRR